MSNETRGRITEPDLVEIEGVLKWMTPPRSDARRMITEIRAQWAEITSLEEALDLANQQGIISEQRFQAAFSGLQELMRYSEHEDGCSAPVLSSTRAMWDACTCKHTTWIKEALAKAQQVTGAQDE